MGVPPGPKKTKIKSRTARLNLAKHILKSKLMCLLQSKQLKAVENPWLFGLVNDGRSFRTSSRIQTTSLTFLTSKMNKKICKVFSLTETIQQNSQSSQLQYDSVTDSDICPFQRMIPNAKSVDEVMKKCFKISKQSNVKQSIIHELKKQLSILKADYLESDEEEHDSGDDDGYDDDIDDARLNEGKSHESKDEHDDGNEEENETPSQLGTFTSDNDRVTVADNGLEQIMNRK